MAFVTRDIQDVDFCKVLGVRTVADSIAGHIQAVCVFKPDDSTPETALRLEGGSTYAGNITFTYPSDGSDGVTSVGDPLTSSQIQSYSGYQSMTTPEQGPGIDFKVWNNPQGILFSNDFSGKMARLVPDTSTHDTTPTGKLSVGTLYANTYLNLPAGTYPTDISCTTVTATGNITAGSLTSNGSSTLKGLVVPSGYSATINSLTANGFSVPSGYSASINNLTANGLTVPSGYFTTLQSTTATEYAFANASQPLNTFKVNVINGDNLRFQALSGTGSPKGTFISFSTSATGSNTLAQVLALGPNKDVTTYGTNFMESGTTFLKTARIQNQSGDVKNFFEMFGNNNVFYMQAVSDAGATVGTSLSFRTSTVGSGARNTVLFMDPDLKSTFYGDILQTGGTSATLKALSVPSVTATGDVSGATLTGTVATASQPNITSVGTLGSLNVTGTATMGTCSATTYVGLPTPSISTPLPLTTTNQPTSGQQGYETKFTTTSDTTLAFGTAGTILSFTMPSGLYLVDYAFKIDVTTGTGQYSTPGFVVLTYDNTVDPGTTGIAYSDAGSSLLSPFTGPVLAGGTGTSTFPNVAWCTGSLPGVVYNSTSVTYYVRARGARVTNGSLLYTGSWVRIVRLC